ncbi:hypothetical protein [Gemmatimonas sp.]|uniref:hypothetical protein n=1 Tax=Gemmatimonas sp. TaxID=1962908 RepID=UPI003F716BEF
MPMFAVEEPPTLFAFAMGYVEGERLGDRVTRARPLTSREAVRLLQDIGDFGIARAIDAPTARPGVTRVGEVVGTPKFMSLEQAARDVVDGRSDLNALALVAYFALTGTLAITGESTQRVIVAQLTQTVPSVGSVRAVLPPALVAVIEGRAQNEPGACIATAEALVEANETRGGAEADALTTITVIAAFIGARLVHVAQARRRLTALGYDGTVRYAGLTQQLDDRAALAAAVRAQPDDLQRQRQLLLVGAALLPLAWLLGEVGMAGRTQLGEMKGSVPPWAPALFYLNSALNGVGLVLVAAAR